MNNEIGEAIAYYRKKAGMKRKTLAEKLGVSEMTISNYENGKTSPDMNSVVTIAHFLSVSTDEFLGYSPVKKL